MSKQNLESILSKEEEKITGCEYNGNRCNGRGRGDCNNYNVCLWYRYIEIRLWTWWQIDDNHTPTEKEKYKLYEVRKRV